MNRKGITEFQASVVLLAIAFSVIGAYVLFIEIPAVTPNSPSSQTTNNISVGIEPAPCPYGIMHLATVQGPDNITQVIVFQSSGNNEQVCGVISTVTK